MLMLSVVFVVSVAVVGAEKSCDCGPSLLPCNSLWFEHKLYIKMDEAQPNGNLLISTLGIYRLMMILAEGAVGPTKETIQKCLFVAIWFLKIKCDSFSKMHTDYNEFVTIVIREKVMTTLTELIYNNHFQQYLNDFALKLDENIDIKQIIFYFNDTKWFHMLNKQAMNRTKDLINNVFKVEDYTTETPLIFTNFINFNDTWEYPFTTVTKYAKNNKVFYMMDRRGQFYHDFDKKSKTEYIILNFKTPGYKLALVRETERKYTGPPTNHWNKFQTNSKTSDNALLKIPKFRIEAEHELESVLDSMGLGILFDKERGDFSGTGKEHPQCMSRFFVKTYIDVNEHGVTAAAVTVVVQNSPKRQKPPTAAHYYRPISAYLIAHDYVVFYARVEDPSI